MAKPTKKETTLWQTAREQGLNVPEIAKYTNHSESTINNHTLMLSKSVDATVNEKSLQATRELLKKGQQPTPYVKYIITFAIGICVVFGILGVVVGGLVAWAVGDNVVSNATILGLIFMLVPVLTASVTLLLMGVTGIIIKLYFLIRYRKKISAIKATTKVKVVPSFVKFCFDPVYAIYDVVSQ